MSPTEQHSFPMHSLCQNQQQVPIRHDTVYGPGHRKCAVFHPAGRRDGEDGWDGLPTQYTVRGLKDLVIDKVLLQSIIVAISYTGDKWWCTVNPMIKDILSVV